MTVHALTIEDEKKKKEIIQTFRNCRLDQVMTQAELAKKSGMSQSNIGALEMSHKNRTNTSLNTLIQWARGLGKELKIELVDKKTAP